MTVNELKDRVNKIPEEYDNLPVITDDHAYGIYRNLGSSDIDVDDIDECVSYDKKTYYIAFRF